MIPVWAATDAVLAALVLAVIGCRVCLRLGEERARAEAARKTRAHRAHARRMVADAQAENAALEQRIQAQEAILRVFEKANGRLTKELAAQQATNHDLRAFRDVIGGETW